MSLIELRFICQTQGTARDGRPQVPGVAQHAAPFGHPADYSARRISLGADDLPPGKRRVRRRLPRDLAKREAQFHRLTGQPDRVDTAHGVSSRTNRVHSLKSEGHLFTVMICSPNGRLMNADDPRLPFRGDVYRNNRRQRCG